MLKYFRNNDFVMTAPVASSVTSSGATVTGSLTDYKGLLTEWGFQYKKHSATSWTGKKVTGTTLSANLTSLDADTKYDVRVYGKIGTAVQYGPEASFETEEETPAE